MPHPELQTVDYYNNSNILLKVVNNCQYTYTRRSMHSLELNVEVNISAYKNLKESCSNLFKEKYFLIKYQI